MVGLLLYSVKYVLTDTFPRAKRLSALSKTLKTDPEPISCFTYTIVLTLVTRGLTYLA